MRLLAIDPGVTGAIALLDAKGKFLDVRDMPAADRRVSGHVKRQIDAPALFALLAELLAGAPARVAVEEVGVIRPGRGVSTQGSLLYSAGIIEGVLGAHGILAEPITPQFWKARVGLAQNSKLSDTAKKRASLDMARQLFPSAPLELVKHHGRADALLIAYATKTWGR